MYSRISHLIVFAAIAASSRAANSAQPSDLASTAALVRTLQQQGATVSRADTLPQTAYPFFAVNAQRILVDGADVQVFEYPSATRANGDASKVSPTGSPIGQSWIRPGAATVMAAIVMIVVAVLMMTRSGGASLWYGLAFLILGPLAALAGGPLCRGRRTGHADRAD